MRLPISCKASCTVNQMAALAMAIFIRGMDADETSALTEQMLLSGTTIERSSDWPPKVDKHSTGGISDKTSLVLAPLLACCGVCVPMISGRGLGPTGGTLDKLESIPGFGASLDINEIREITERIGCVICGTTADIAPADRRLHTLRDVTATVASIPLITASIMSKKLAEKLDAPVLDVKFGSGAFMKTIDDARRLALSLVRVGKQMGVKTAAMLTNMHQPLGRMVDNAVEVDEAVATLAGDGPQDLVELTVSLGAEVLASVNPSVTVDGARKELSDTLRSGEALGRFRAMVAAQGGDLEAIRTVAPSYVIDAQQSGYITGMNCEEFGHAVIQMGGRRRLMTDQLDHSVGLEFLAKIGDEAKAGQPILRVFGSHTAGTAIRLTLEKAIVIEDQPAEPLSLIAERVTADHE